MKTTLSVCVLVLCAACYAQDARQRAIDEAAAYTYLGCYDAKEFHPDVRKEIASYMRDHGRVTEEMKLKSILKVIRANPTPERIAVIIRCLKGLEPSEHAIGVFKAYDLRTALEKFN